MASIFKRVKTAHQPIDGYIPVSDFNHIQSTQGQMNMLCENIGENFVLLAIEYILQVHCSKSYEKAMSVLEAALYEATYSNKKALMESIYNGITSKEPATRADYAVRLAKFESYYRVGNISENAVPDASCLESICRMSDRCKDFFKDSIKLFGFDFEGGYTTSITSGNGGYLTNDTLWNITVSHCGITQYDTLLILVQYIMGLHSYRSRLFRKVKRLGIYNPRLCKEYTLDIRDIPSRVIEEVSKSIIGYE